MKDSMAFWNGSPASRRICWPAQLTSVPQLGMYSRGIAQLGPWRDEPFSGPVYSFSLSTILGAWGSVVKVMGASASRPWSSCLRIVSV